MSGGSGRWRVSSGVLEQCGWPAARRSHFGAVGAPAAKGAAGVSFQGEPAFMDQVVIAAQHARLSRPSFRRQSSGPGGSPAESSPSTSRPRSRAFRSRSPLSVGRVGDRRGATERFCDSSVVRSVAVGRAGVVGFPVRRVFRTPVSPSLIRAVRVGVGVLPIVELIAAVRTGGQGWGSKRRRRPATRTSRRLARTCSPSRLPPPQPATPPGVRQNLYCCPWHGRNHRCSALPIK